MTTWHDYLREQGHAPDWPYPIRYENEQQVNCDVLVVGGGIAGCWAAIGAARQGLRVALVEKGDTVRSGSGGPGCDHWCNAPANPLSNVDPDEWAEHMADRPYANGIGIQIQCREDWDTLLEMEQMGGKIRDTNGEYSGAQGRDRHRDGRGLACRAGSLGVFRIDNRRLSASADDQSSSPSPYNRIIMDATKMSGPGGTPPGPLDPFNGSYYSLRPLPHLLCGRSGRNHNLTQRSGSRCGNRRPSGCRHSRCWRP